MHGVAMDRSKLLPKTSAKSVYCLADKDVSGALPGTAAQGHTHCQAAGLKLAQ